MRRRLLLVVAIAAAACSNDPPLPKVDPSARPAGQSPPRLPFGDQKRPPIDLRATTPPPKMMTSEEFRKAFDDVCNASGKCNKYLVAGLVTGATPPIAKDLIKMCWDARKAATTRLRSFATELGRVEALSRRAPHHSNPARCVELERLDRAGLASLEKGFGAFDAETPELSEMRAALDAVGKCHGCEGPHVPQCDQARKATAVVMKLATAKQDPFCKDQFKTGK